MALPTGYTADLSGVGAPGTAGGPTSLSQNQSRGQNVAQMTSQQQSSTYIPEYSQTPILNEIAQYARSMAPQVYQWGMEQYGKNQGNIDAMMRNALSYGSGQRVASEMGKAQAGVMQGAEAGRQNAIRDLQSYGIDPSSGRYAALDKASQVMAGAAAAGAGNVQRDVVQKTAGEMQNQAMGLSLQNNQIGYGASNAMNQLLGTGIQLKYSPLGQTSSGSSQSSSQGTNESDAYSMGFSGGGGGGGEQTLTNMQWGNQSGSAPAPMHIVKLAGGGSVPDDEVTAGGFVSHELSPSNGAQVDDVDARLNAGEFVIPKDVAQWKGQEFFYKLMAQARKMRATAGQDGGGMGYAENDQQQLGYGAA